MNFTYIPYSETHSFTQLATDYVRQDPKLDSFLQFQPDMEGIKKAVKERGNYPVDRKLLHEVLKNQYSTLAPHDKVAANLELLLSENTFTITTAHQPNLLTGYLYFIYKIMHAIRLAEELNRSIPDKHFVPVYYMGSEDNDIDELGTFRYNGKRYTWDGASQRGAVGRMSTSSLEPLLADLLKTLGPPGPACDELSELIREAYLRHPTISDATIYLVHQLFGRYGLLILNPDDRKLKGQFADIMTDELLHENSQPLVAAQMDKLSVHYKAQAHPRNINLFYLSEGLRERIEKRDDKWIVVNTDKSWSKEELLSEVASFPERFSPNVILRGLFQETILPDVAFIGGGAEVAYWLQLGSLFRHYNCFFPVILLRQSIQWVTADEGRLLEQLQLQPADVFLPESALVRQFVSRQALDEWQTASETKQLETLMTAIKEKATALDPTLRSSADAALTKMRYQLQVLEKKMLRAEKRKMQDSVARIQKLRRLAMPAGSLQERTENFMSWYLRFGNDYLKILADAIDPLRNEFLIIRERENS